MNTVNVSAYDLLVMISKAVDLVGGAQSRHGLQVAYGAWTLAEQCSLSTAEKQTIALAGLIHDIGVSSALVRKSLGLHLEIDASFAFQHAQRAHDLLYGINYLSDVSELLRYHHHRYNGENRDGIAGEQIPIGSRILHLIDRVSILIGPNYVLHQRAAVMQQIKEYSGSHFDPKLIQLLDETSTKASFWLDFTSDYLEQMIRQCLDGISFELSPTDITVTCQMLAQIIDDKSPFTHRHSLGVASVARELARRLAFGPREVAEMELAGHLHDLGKLAVPDEVLDKPGKLTADEMALMHQHPYHTYRILSRIPSLERIARWGAYHHECLDGSGYPFGLGRSDLDMGCQIMAVADIFQALHQDRPYRPAMESSETKSILAYKVRKGHLSGEIVELLFEDFAFFSQLAVY